MPRACIRACGKSSKPDQVFWTAISLPTRYAPAHTANMTQDWMKYNTSNFIHKEEWPPYSPYLNPMGYSVWSILENKAYSVSHNTVNSLKISLYREWEKIPPRNPTTVV
ncbi:hypothetical protein LOD99_7436 [Oopsacas minuta]|uniref:Uncharacterized protein n=1 Tax=Oopsacas minuta TaxID=111878 RepID=A0AAV7JUE7_9METZ|nr:hypothetical protein LOD99_7436 [Oopsacas minuta]